MGIFGHISLPWLGSYDDAIHDLRLVLELDSQDVVKMTTRLAQVGFLSTDRCSSLTQLSSGVSACCDDETIFKRHARNSPAITIRHGAAGTLSEAL